MNEAYTQVLFARSVLGVIQGGNAHCTDISMCKLASPSHHMYLHHTCVAKEALRSTLTAAKARGLPKMGDNAYGTALYTTCMEETQ